MKLYPSYRHMAVLVAIVLAGAACTSQQEAEVRSNPFDVALNEPIAYGEVTAADITEHVDTVMAHLQNEAEAIRGEEFPDFDNVVRRFDGIYRDISKTGNRSFMLYWTSTDADVREVGIEAYKKLDSMRVDFYSDREIFEQIQRVAMTQDLTGNKKRLVEDLIAQMRYTGVDLEPLALEEFKALTQELNDLSSEYSDNMNTDGSILSLDEHGARGLPAGLISKYRTDDGGYEIPVISATNRPVMNNAADENTRRAFATLYANRAMDKNLEILDQLVAKRHQMALIMGYPTYADYKPFRQNGPKSGQCLEFPGRTH